jgi:hypothetical protein
LATPLGLAPRIFLNLSGIGAEKYLTHCNNSLCIVGASGGLSYLPLTSRAFAAVSNYNTIYFIFKCDKFSAPIT